MPTFRLAAIALICIPGTAIACDYVPFEDDEARLKVALASAGQAVALIDGVVVRGNADTGSVATVRPTRLWFGPRQAAYRIARQSDCDTSLHQGERVRIALYAPTRQPGWFDRVRQLSGVPTYGASDFSWSLRYRAMRRVVERRRRSGRR